MKWAFLFYIFIFSFTSVAQQLTFENIDIRDGLPSSEVYNIHQDKFGYVWIFTEYGIVKYNGDKYVPVCRNLDIKHTEVYAVTETSEGVLYFMNSLAELYKVVKDKAYRLPGTESLTNEIIKRGDDIYALNFTCKGELLLNGLVKGYSLSSEIVSQGKTKASLKPRIQEVIGYKQGFYKSTNYAVIIDKNDNRRYLLNKKRFTSGRFMFKRFKQNSIVVYGKTGVTTYSPKRTRSLDFGSGVLKVEVDKKGHIWVCVTKQGLFELDQDLNIKNHYFAGLSVSDILFDSQNGIWITTLTNGVYHCDNSERFSYTNEDEPLHSITSLAVFNKKLFVGTDLGVLFALDRNGFQRIELAEHTQGIRKVKFIDGRYYILTNSGFFVSDISLKFKEIVLPYIGLLEGRPQQLNENQYPSIIYEIEKFNDHELLMLNPAHLFRYDFEKRIGKIIAARGKIRHVVMRNNEIFFDSPEGIFRYANNKVDKPGYLKKLDGIKITKITKDKKGNLWFCTIGEGIFCLKPSNEMVHLKNLPTEIVYDIYFGENNVVLISTNVGAFAKLEGELRSNKNWKQLLRDETSCAVIYDDSVFFGTKNGLKTISCSKIFDVNICQFWLNSVEDENKNEVLLASNYLEYYQNDLHFNYDFIDLQPHNLVLQYELNGPSSSSGTEESGQIHLQNLEPGTYKLTVYPKVDFGNGKDLKQTILFTIKPAIWQTAWFYIVVLLFFTAAVVIIVVIINKRKARTLLIRQNFEKQLAEYRLTALKAQINPHFMSNSLAAIQNLMLENKTDEANLYLAKFSLMLRLLLEYSSKSYTSVKNEINVLKLYIELEQLRFNNKFSYEIEIDEEIDINETIIPSLITQPIIENAIWHGLLPLEDHEKAKLTISFKLVDEDLHISILDNGVGRIAPKESSKKHISRGTELIVGRLETLNQLYGTNGGQLIYVDNRDEFNNPSGTNVSIILPVKILDELYEQKNI